MTIRRITLLSLTAQYVASSAFVPQSSDLSRQAQTHLNMENSHRARVEKNLEDMMGNDWRMFRAQLVAQENAEKKNEAARDPYSTYAKITANQASHAARSNASSSNHHSNKNQPFDEKQAKQEKFGNIFAAIFSHNKDGQQNEGQKSNPSSSFSSTRLRYSRSSIFDGLHVGGATPDSMIPDSCEDPFVSAAELPVLLKPKVQVDKHRWAHPLSHIEPGCVLIANEKLGGVFHQTVVLIVEHNEGAGSTGIVINRCAENSELWLCSILSFTFFNTHLISSIFFSFPSKFPDH